MAEASSGAKAHWVQHDGESRRLRGDARAADPTPRTVEPGGTVNSGATVSCWRPGQLWRHGNEDDAVLMLYTAAFAGRPGGALLSHRALVTQGALLGSLQGIGADYVYLNCGPLFHVATLMTTLATFVAGGTNVFTPSVDAEELCRLIESERCTGAFIMPPTIKQIIEMNPDGRYDLHTLRTFAGNRAWTAMITPDDSPWGRHPGGYGQTEVMGLVSFGALGPSKGSQAGPRRSFGSGYSTPRATRWSRARPARSACAGRQS